MQDCTIERKAHHDRFIPPRTNSRYSSGKPMHLERITSENKNDAYQTLISNHMLNDTMIDQSHSQSLYSSNYCMSSVKTLLQRKSEVVEQKVTKRNIHLSPEKVLDAPQIKDDYYLNLLDWSSKGLLSIGLGERVYLYSSSHIGELCQKEDDYICSVAFHPQGEQLSVGLSSGIVEIYDLETQTVIRTLKGHSNRVSSSSFTYGMLFTGSRDTKIIGHDYRSKHNISMKFLGHKGQVCGLKHDSCGLASGSNDNQAMIWDLNTSKMRYQLSGHQAAVKALAWCPWQRNLLATGGGSSDKTMRFWNIETGKIINTIHTDSQVCSLIWNKNDKEILSSHGFSENQLSLWKYPTFTKVADLHGHTQRVLHMAMSPDNSTICTASADETLRFWKVFENGSNQESDEKENCKLNIKFCGIR